MNDRERLEAVQHEFEAARLGDPYIDHTGGGIFVVVLEIVDGTIIVGLDGPYNVGFYAGRGWHNGAEETRIVWGLETVDAVVDAARTMGATGIRKIDHATMNTAFICGVIVEKLADGPVDVLDWNRALHLSEEHLREFPRRSLY